MSLCFTGPVLDFSGFAHAASNMLAALRKSDLDIVVRPLRYDNGSKFVSPDWMNEMMRRPLTGINMLIQCTTPNIEAVPKPGICNGIYTFVECDRIPFTWAAKLNKFDFIIVSSKYNASAMVNSGVTKPILVIPIPFDSETVLCEPSESSLINANGRTVFYNISQLSGKKGIDALIRAYISAFVDKPDEVLLVLKTYVNMGDRSRDRQIIKNFIDKVKQGARIPSNKLPPIQVITDTLDNSQMSRLHKDCHVYVCSSRTEGFCIPAFDAMAYGNVLISNNYGGLAEFVNPNTAIIYGGCETNCFDMPHHDPSHFTGMSRWFEPSTSQMADSMRIYHELRTSQELGLSEENQNVWDSICSRQKNGENLALKFAISEICDKICNQILEVHNSWSSNGFVNLK